MELLDISQQPEHINYNNRDELGILVVAYNKMVDDVNESTRRLAAGEREQAWREMARQIAHEIKNPLTPMRLSIQHLMRLKEQGVKDWPNRFDSLANSLIEQIDILSDAAGEFSSFSRFYSEELTRFDLNTLIREQLILFNTRDNIVLSIESSAKDAFVIARRTQLTRVFVNLFSNAVQAVEQQEDGGSIIITVDRGADYYEVRVEDDGPGVPESLTHRLFKPNFTTKSGGTGLGLAICRSIMEQSQGSIYYEKSQKLRGASFVVRIPV
jgi:nitrogen fixation/metabolism regulation signal transduction histidine kinase